MYSFSEVSYLPRSFALFFYLVLVVYLSSTFLRYAHGYIGWRTGSSNPISCEQASNHHGFLYTAKWLHISSNHHC